MGVASAFAQGFPMAPPRKQIAPDIVAEAKRLYEQTITPTYDIAAMMGISRSTFNNRVSDWGWTRRGVNNPAVDIARVVRGSAVTTLTANAAIDAAADITRLEAAPPMQRAALAARIQGIVEREMDAVERVLGRLGPADQAEAERSARTLASVARTLREIAALIKPDQVTPPDDADDDPVPRDIDELRHELARRIHTIIDAQRAEDSGGGDGASARPEARRS